MPEMPAGLAGGDQPGLRAGRPGWPGAARAAAGRGERRVAAGGGGTTGGCRAARRDRAGGLTGTAVTFRAAAAK